MFRNFINVYPLSKTLKFELRPQFTTAQNIEKHGLLTKDQQKADDYKIAKKIIDAFHKDFIGKNLSTLVLPEQWLEEYDAFYFNDALSEADKKVFGALRDKLRKCISDHFKAHEDYKKILKEDLFKEIMPTWINNPENLKFYKDAIKDDFEEGANLMVKAIEILNNFDKFSGYFIGYHETRENIYTKDEIATSVGYRLIHDNLPKFLVNRRNLLNIQTKHSELFTEFQQAPIFQQPKLQGISIDDLISLSFFSKTLTQSGIDKFNLVLGGLFLADKKEKIQGLNESVNLFNQSSLSAEKAQRKLENHPENAEQKSEKSFIKVPRFINLFKQILSDREKASFVIQAIDNDEELIEMLKGFQDNILLNPQLNDESLPKNLIKAFSETLKELQFAEHDKIWVKNDTNLTTISQELFDDFSLIGKALDYLYEKNNPDYQKLEKSGKAPTKKMAETKEKYLKQNYFNLELLQNALDHYVEHLAENLDKDKDLEEKFTRKFKDKKIINYFTQNTLQLNDESKISFDEVENGLYQIIEKLENLDNPEHKIAQNKDIVAEMKQALDNVNALLWRFKPLYIQSRNNESEESSQSNYEKDFNFYTNFDELYAQLENVIPLYNQVRNYMTKKPYSDQKFKLNFENPSLLDGWDVNKEDDNACVLLRKKALRKSGANYYRYFLALQNKKDKKDHSLFNSGSKKQLVKSPAQGDEAFEKMYYKLLPGANKMLPKVFLSSAKGLEAYKPSANILDIYKGERFKKGCSLFNLTDLHALIDYFKDCIAKHEDWSKFNHQFSKTETYQDISAFYREVEQQGYKVWFEEYSAKHIQSLVEKEKMYLFEIYNKDFSPESTGSPNLHTLYFEALFSEENLKNVIYKLNGQAEIFYRKASLKPEITHPKNVAFDRKKEESGNKKSKFTHDLIKDKRFTKDSFHFHVPITMNFKATGNAYINDKVHEYIYGAQFADKAHTKPMNVIGIDRGEKHLLYISVVDQKGKLLHQESLNTLTGVNYHQKLDSVENSRQESRKNWKSVETIKDLKSGYLSIVVNKIAELMMQYHAIIVMENLNGGFKRSRIHIEKSVYQNFEKALIEKLNYLCFKKQTDEKPGIMNALQLSNKFESFQKMGFQSGFIFYIQAAYTSKIDPLTGFVNVIDARYENAKKATSLLEKFESIRFNPDKNYFEFKIDDIMKFNAKAAGMKKDWLICTHHEIRYAYDSKDKSIKKVHVTQALKEVFEKENIDYKSGAELKNIIISLGANNQASFIKSLLYYLNLTLTMRYDAGREADLKEQNFILSPVCNEKGVFFDSRAYVHLADNAAELPKDADANGAYHIGLKGLMVLENIQKNYDPVDPKKNKLDLKVDQKTWFEYAAKMAETK